MQALSVAVADTAWIAATARGLREAALDHGFRCTDESLYQWLLLLKHRLILSYTCLYFVSRKN
jgi:hypothetical protein